VRELGARWTKELAEYTALASKDAPKVKGKKK
jgi:hypothetical protein